MPLLFISRKEENSVPSAASTVWTVGDVPVTYADTQALERDYSFKPSTTLREGLRKFAEWYKEFYM